MQTLLNLYIYVVVLRFLLQSYRVRYDNTLAIWVLKVTQPAIRPLQKIFPEIKKIDLAILAYIFILEALKFSLIHLSALSTPPSALLLFLSSFGDFLLHLTNLYFYAIMIRALFNWTMVLGYRPTYNPLFCVAVQVSEPVLSLVRQIIKPMGMLDFSPLIALILIQLSQSFLIIPLFF